MRISQRCVRSVVRLGFGKSRSTVSVLGKIRKISLTNVGPPLTNDNDNDARLLSLRPGSLDAAGTVAAIFANLLAGQCLRPQRLAGGLDMSRIVATLHPVVSTRCSLCGCGVQAVDHTLPPNRRLHRRSETDLLLRTFAGNTCPEVNCME